LSFGNLLVAKLAVLLAFERFQKSTGGPLSQAASENQPLKSVSQTARRKGEMGGCFCRHEENAGERNTKFLGWDILYDAFASV